MTMTVYPTVAARHAAVARAKAAKESACWDLDVALERGDRPAAQAANEGLIRADREWRRALNEEWKIEEAE